MNSTSTIVEFNSDNFFCNTLGKGIQQPTCTDYSLLTDCSTIKSTYNTNLDSNNKIACELCKNYEYYELYKSYQTTSGNYIDAVNKYNNAWIQRWNLGIGISLLLLVLYNQK